MKETLQAINWNDLLKKYFVEVMDFVKGAKDFASEQVPLYLKELIAYEFWHSIIWAIVHGLFLIVSIFLYKHCRKWYSKSEGDEAVFSGAGVCLFVVTSVLFAIQSINYTDHAVKAAVAPRLIIVERIKEIIHGTEDVNNCRGR